MSFARDEALQLERCISIENDGPRRVPVFRYGEFRSDGPPFDVNTQAKAVAEEFAVNVAGDLKEQRGRLGKTLPWRAR